MWIIVQTVDTYECNVKEYNQEVIWTNPLHEVTLSKIKKQRLDIWLYSATSRYEMHSIYVLQYDSYMDLCHLKFLSR